VQGVDFGGGDGVCYFGVGRGGAEWRVISGVNRGDEGFVVRVELRALGGWLGRVSDGGY
jgi:hypothetical protein